jgi:hypothetical protein
MKITAEMKEWYEKRMVRHISLVQKYAERLEKNANVKGLIKQAKKHDASKFIDPELTPYVFISWKYRQADLNKEFKVPSDLHKKMNEATLHHIKTNSHHPDFHEPDQSKVSINTKDRDSIDTSLATDATSMPDIDLAEMVADWCAMGEERGNTAKSWADQAINTRWKFSDRQVKRIYELIEIASKEK